MNTIVSCRRLAAGFAFGLLALMLGVSPVAADVFTLDPNQSSMTLSGSISGIPFAQQGAGSLTTKYDGTIQASQTANTIQFTGLSLITARTNGSWRPSVGGNSGTSNAPGNYGAMANLGIATAYASFRSMLLDVTSPQIAVTAGQFNSTNLTFLFPSIVTSKLDYNAGFLGFGSLPLAGEATNNVAALATLTTVGNQQTLTLAVNVRFIFDVISDGDTIVNVTGQLVAIRTTTSPLVIQSPKVTNQMVTLNWQSPAGQFYQVLSSTNLQSWQTNASNVTSASTNYTWTGTNPARSGFYRVAP